MLPIAAANAVNTTAAKEPAIRPKVLPPLNFRACTLEISAIATATCPLEPPRGAVDSQACSVSFRSLALLSVTCDPSRRVMRSVRDDALSTAGAGASS